MNRRSFLQRTGAVAGLLANPGLMAAAGDAKVSLVCDPSDAVAAAAPVQWAIGQLREALAARGLSVRLCRQLNEVAPEERCVVVGSATAPLPRETLAAVGVTVPGSPEALALVPGQINKRQILLATASDARGLAYVLLDLADQAALTDTPQTVLAPARPVVDRPANPIRSVTRLFASEVEDKAWLHDRSFWTRYLTMLAGERFSRFSLTLGLGYDFTRGIRDAYLHFAYPFLAAVPGYQVRAVGLPDGERAKNLETLRFISDETAKRGLHFQLGLWTHAYQWTESPNANYTIEGLTPATHAAYCREALGIVLRECPAIDGVTFRVHGESGMTEGSYDFWKTVFDGIVRSGRKVEIDLHAKGLDQPLIDVALATGMPVQISPKFWAEHMGLPYHQAAIRALELPPRDRKDEGFFAKSNGSRRFLRYGYGDLLSEGRRYGVYYRMWPGTQRLLLWGSPAMAAAYGRSSSFCGSLGLELCEPLSFKGRKGSGLPGGRTAYQDRDLQPAQDWEKYHYTYRLWGRLLYNPDAEPESWRRLLRKDWGAGTDAAEAALAHASRILPLVTTAHLPSAANNNYWPEMYTNQSIPDARAPHPYSDTPSPKRFGTVSPLDPELFSGIDEYVDVVLKGKSSAKYAPDEVARWLDDLATVATKHLTEARQRQAPEKNPSLLRLVKDVEILAGLGRFFAHKLQAGVLYAAYDRTHLASALAQAIQEYRLARDAWAQLSQTAGVYRRDVTFGYDKHLRGHWADRLPAIDEDIARLQKLAAEIVEPPGQRTIWGMLPPKRPSLACQHTPPASFRPGQEVAIELSIDKAPREVLLHYRHVHQAEAYQVAAMRAEANRWRTTIPAAYTQSAYPLQYYFELRTEQDGAGLYPGLGANLCQQPYFVVRQTS
jgi:hypothetical protein